MSFHAREPALDYYPCRYGRCRITFRGPRAALRPPYTVVVGGAETFGRYVEDPFTEQLAERTGRRIINLGILNAGIDAFLRDDALMEIIRGAETVVVQVMGAHNLSNRFYTVHPRRNDRFLRHSMALASLFPEVDFSDYAFTRHMLAGLRAARPEAFSLVVQELRAAWTARTRLFLSHIPGCKIMLWIENSGRTTFGPEPPFVDIDMLQAIEGEIDKFVHCDVGDDMTDAGLDEMVFPDGERAGAEMMLRPEAHARIARHLSRAVGMRSGIAA
ncbi:DUF6473 family protein [uncultured Jannaschia sp.]|uniref:DUF6473 family protein n=1 Tax=uncultured Jannaschia sp. TaxID=293347 RepID=UPI00262E2D38|nr:DUF6473 family protein [uncultured Jannaschia sp.]